MDYILLITTWVLLITAFMSIAGNGTIILTVIKNPPLRKRDCLYLISALAVADFLTAWGNVPYAVDLLVSVKENCTQPSLAILFAQNLAGARMNQIITLGLGLDRIYAVFRPIQYRTSNHLRIAQFSAAFSFSLAFVDAGTYLLQQQQQQQHSNCSQTVSTTSSNFSLQIFRLFSNMIINFVTLIVHIIMIWKLRKMTLENMNEESRSHFRQASDAIALILLASLAFVTVPCIIQLFDYFAGDVFFQKYSAILNIGNNLNGAINVTFYAWRHKEFHDGMKKLCTCSTNRIHDGILQGRMIDMAHGKDDRMPHPIARHLNVPRPLRLVKEDDHIVVSM